MERVAQRKSWAAKLEDAICPRIIIKLEKLKEKAGHYQALGASNG